MFAYTETRGLMWKLFRRVQAARRRRHAERRHNEALFQAAVEVLQPVLPDEVTKRLHQLVGSLAAHTNRPAEDYMRPLATTVQTMWLEANRQILLNTYEPL